LAFLCHFSTIHSQSRENDTFPVDHFIINLDLPPEQRWNELLSIPKYINTVNNMFDDIISVLPQFLHQYVWDIASYIGNYLEDYIHEPYASEMRGVAKALNKTTGEIVILNIFYDFSAWCTSLVAQANDGTIYHARNLDFSFVGHGYQFTDDLQNLTVQIEFQKSNKTLFYATTYAGYIGVLTGMRPSKLGISVNERNDAYLIMNFIKALEDLYGGNTKILSFFLRDLLMSDMTYAEAKDSIINQELFASVYLTISGSKPGEGSVITRNRESTQNVWDLDASGNPSTWFLLQTNDDHWGPPKDSRRDTGFKAMNAMGRDKLSVDRLLEVLSTKPVLNKFTTYSAFFSPTTGLYETFKRNCPDPCPNG